MGKWRITKAEDGAWEAWCERVMWFVGNSWAEVVRAVDRELRSGL